MDTKPTLSFTTLLLLISFASVNAVLFTPALPDISLFFNISTETAQYTITFFLTGYAVGQLIYGPLANRFGRKAALYIGIALQIASCFLCVLSGVLDQYALMVLGRFLLALGSGVGLKMTFTLVNECYEPKAASQKIAYLLLGFSVTPGLAVALGGFLAAHYGWESCFYASALYGLIVGLMASRLPETLPLNLRNKNALNTRYLLRSYGALLHNPGLIAGGLIMGASTCFVYVFAAVAPFVAMSLLGMSSEQYGSANILPCIGLVAGSLFSAKIVKNYPLIAIIKIGIIIIFAGTLLMGVAARTASSPVLFLFIPMIVIYFGSALVMANASTVAMSQVTDKAHGSSVMSFINMGLATLVVLSLGYCPVSVTLLPCVFLGLCCFTLAVYKWLTLRLASSSGTSIA